MISLRLSSGWNGTTKRGAVRLPMAQMSVKTRVKICGVTNVEDGKHALSLGADLIGMIMWPKAKRHVSLQTAKNVTEMTKTFPKDAEGFPKVVGVFVDETADQIEDIREQTNIDVVQLHGDGARTALADLRADIPVMYVLHADQKGHTEVHNEVRNERYIVAIGHLTGIDNRLEAPVDWILIDGQRGGSGECIPWKRLKLPNWMNNREIVRQGWLLAGGLTPNNVADALSILRTRGLRPLGVDVSSGVCDEGGVKKHPPKIQEFIHRTQK